MASLYLHQMITKSRKRRSPGFPAETLGHDPDSTSDPKHELDLETAEPKLMNQMDLMLGEWLSLTSLYGPKISVVQMVCCVPTVLTASTKKKCLQVEVFGSGVVVLPCFHFDATTTTDELFAAVRQEQQTSVEASEFRLMFREKELTESTETKQYVNQRMVVEKAVKLLQRDVGIQDQDTVSLLVDNARAAVKAG